MQSAADGFKSGRWEGKEYKAIIPKQAQRMPISYMEPRRISISSRSSATSEASEESQRTTNRIIPIIAMARNYSSNHLKEERKEQRARERERERESAVEGGGEENSAEFRNRFPLWSRKQVTRFRNMTKQWDTFFPRPQLLILCDLY